jgi:hypothetical protein
VLPLAFGAAKGNIPEAGATLLLDYVKRALLGLSAIYADEALATLRIAVAGLERLDAGWPDVIDQHAVRAAWVSIARMSHWSISSREKQTFRFLRYARTTPSVLSGSANALCSQSTSFLA